SLRRKTQLLKIRPDLELVDIRGNVGTRIEKLRRLNLDALLLAYAGLMRLGLQDVVTEVIDTGIIIPAAGQGALAVETLRDDEEIIQLVKVVEDRDTRIAVEAERLLMAKIGGGCDIPAAAYARVVDNRITVEGMVADNPPNGEVFKEKAEGHVNDAAKIVEILAERLVSKKVKAAGV
ncbi:MAG TPA: hydroxymethylbilane synthase, partial [Aigarchaeota archaeon]|nr:hydroxymethylbilane synthase [Aigarchaeota archaeon]